MCVRMYILSKMMRFGSALSVQISVPQESIKRGVQTSFTIVTRDQYFELVVAHHLQVNRQRNLECR